MIALDLSRLLSRAGSATPSGIDRVELAYARHLIARDGPHCFAALNAAGRIGGLPAAAGRPFVAALAAAWRDGATGEESRRLIALARRLRHLALFGGERRLNDAMARCDGRSAYLLVSHQHLDRACAIARLKMRTGARFVCLVHDLIPLDFPHYTRPRQTRRHRRRIAAAAVLADAVIANSQATRIALRRHTGMEKPVAVVPLGLDLHRPPVAEKPAGPYFVCIGTIEARKNQSLLLDLWQRLAVRLGERTPRLLLIGQRGWGSEKISGRLAALPGIVVEHRGLPDRHVARLLCGARALLLPSRAEGFGLPVIEALSLGVPVICSDLPALRESGGGVPDYLDPADPAAWYAAILDYIADSQRRKTQLARLRGWRAPGWDDHFAVVDPIVAGLIESASGPG